jgi:mannose/fructose/N-acetylgalactosamine-specific phosphotransferase system component IIC
MEPLGGLLLLALGAWAALDSVSVGQFMVSRPLVTGTLAGALLGDPNTGFILGLFMELAHLGSPPVGGARLPEPGPAAIGGVAAATWIGGPGGLAVGLALGLLLSLLGGWTVGLKRHWHGRLVDGLTRGELSATGLTARLTLAAAVEALRGVALTLVGLGLARALPPRIGEWWPLAGGSTLLLVALVLAFPAGGLLRALPAGSGRLGLLAAGGAVGAALGVWLAGGG